tara:strand:- start:1229 stop:1678 length:450 start_codon:yes stop_codon:yes gene_type:complete
LNFFLHINRNLIISCGILIIILLLLLIFSKQFSFSNLEIEISKKNLSNVDIAEPKFTINNDSKKIYITAEEGNFLNKDEIQLNNNVRFNSNEFSIETENVIFNRNNQTAKSNSKSLFKSKNSTISSEGFDIYDNGNKIVFYGNSVLVLK